MKVIGLTGGIASGKSTVSEYLHRKGAVILDADAIAHELTEPGGSLHKAYGEHFGPSVLLPDGRIDRNAVGRKVFGSLQERQWLDSVSHPLIRQEIERQLLAKKNEQPPLIVLDVPLLFETGWDKMAEKTCLVYVDEAVQLERLMLRNGYGKEEAAARIRTQMPLREKMKRADYLIDNNGSLPSTLRQADILWKEWTHVRLSQQGSV